MATLLCQTKLVQLSAEEYLELLLCKEEVLKYDQLVNPEDLSRNSKIEALKVEIQQVASIIINK